MRIRVLAALCAGLAILSCVEDGRSKANTDAGAKAAGLDRKTGNIDRFMREGPGFPVGYSLAEIRKNLGEPLKQSVSERQNIHNKTLVDEIHKLYYDGLYIEVYRVTEMNKDILLQFEVTGDQYPVVFGLKVGSPKQKVKDAFGRPNEERADLWRYHASDFVMGSFEFAFQKDAVSLIRWYYSID